MASNIIKIERLHEDMWLFVGRELESVCTVVRNGSDALLVDGMAVVEDARELKRFLTDELGLHVKYIIPTHYYCDHLAALQLFPEAQIISHRLSRHVFQAQQHDEARDSMFVPPTLEFEGTIRLWWGNHPLDVSHNPGKTLDMLLIDAPSLDVVFVGDQLVGNTVYLSKSDPLLVERALLYGRSKGRSKVVAGHIGCFDAGIFDRALHYLRTLCQLVISFRTTLSSMLASEQIQSISIEQCIAEGVIPTEFEREWHTRNLESIREQGLFALEAYLEKTKHSDGDMAVDGGTGI